jgi:hypothetical protein
MTIPLLMLLQASGEELYQAGRFAEARDALEREVRSATGLRSNLLLAGLRRTRLGQQTGRHPTL